MSEERDQFAKEREEQAAVLLAAKRQANSKKTKSLKRGPLSSTNGPQSVKRVRNQECETQKVECEIDKENFSAEERLQMAAMLLTAKKNAAKGKKKELQNGLNVVVEEEKKESIGPESANTGMNLDPLKKDQHASLVKENVEVLDGKKGVSENTSINEDEIAKRRDEIRYGFNRFKPQPIRICLTKEFPMSKIRNKLIEKGKARVGAKIKILQNIVYEEDLDLDVPDTEFHDFDSTRTWPDFQKDQVWAAYDDDDGMPRFYALVQKILSKKRFKIRISYLKSRSTAEFGHGRWIGSGFTKTCGDFRVEEKPEIVRSENMFSHRVDFVKGKRGLIVIFPRKGEIWALYKNWSSSWDVRTPDETIHEYEMIQVLEDYEKKKGIWVVDLVKVNGFKTVFKRVEEEMDSVKRFVKREEMFRFSHRVPAFALDGVNGKDGGPSLDGCFELDPAALSIDIVRVEQEVN